MMKLAVALVVLGPLLQQAGTPVIPKDQPLPAKAGMVKRQFAKSFYMLNVPGGWKPDKKPGLILFMHGSGGRAEGAIGTFNMALDKGYLLISPETIQSDRMAWDPEADGENIVAMIEEVVKTFNVDRDRMLCSGFSAGGAQTLPQMAKNVDLFSAGAPCGGCCYNIGLEANPSLAFYIFAGKKDFAWGGAKLAYEEFDRKGFNVRFINPDDIGHAMEPGGWQKIFDWFHGLIPEDQLPYLQQARDLLAKQQPGKAAATLKKLVAMKTVARHAKGRAEWLLKHVNEAGEAELKKAAQIEDPKKTRETLTKLRALYEGSDLAPKIDAILKEKK